MLPYTRKSTDLELTHNQNLDTLDEADLLAVASIFTLLGNYAFLKNRAQISRRTGDVALALETEAACDAIYQRLPESVRW